MTPSVQAYVLFWHLTSRPQFLKRTRVRLFYAQKNYRFNLNQADDICLTGIWCLDILYGSRSYNFGLWNILNFMQFFRVHMIC